MPRLLRGPEHYDSISEKVLSYYFTAEVRDGKFWGVAERKVQGELMPGETQRLIDEIDGQAGDGFGESFEQREIRINYGLEIYAHLYQPTGWTSMTEKDRFDLEFSLKLPDYCWSTLPSAGSLICIQRGVSGYRIIYKVLLEATGCQVLLYAGVLAELLPAYIFSPKISSPAEMTKEELSVILCDPEAKTLLPHVNLQNCGEALIEQCGGKLTGYSLFKRTDGQPIPSPRQGGMPFG